MNNKINVMQGRLSPSINIDKIQEFPYNTWVQEILFTKPIGLNGIEWICNIDLINPLLNIYIINKIRELIDTYEINVNIFCMDFLEDIDEIFNTNSRRLLTSYIEAATLLVNSPIIVIPLFQKLTPEFVDKFESIIYRLMPLGTVYKCAFEINDFDGYRKRFKGHRICYDIGNRQLAAENICEELLEFKYNIRHIHIKEKNEEGVSVPLGQGIIGFAGWEKIFDTLKKIKYRYDFTLQLAREGQGNERLTVRKQFDFIKGLIDA